MSAAGAGAAPSCRRPCPRPTPVTPARGVSPGRPHCPGAGPHSLLCPWCLLTTPLSHGLPHTAGVAPWGSPGPGRFNPPARPSVPLFFRKHEAQDAGSCPRFSPLCRVLKRGHFISDPQERGETSAPGKSLSLPPAQGRAPSRHSALSCGRIFCFVFLRYFPRTDFVTGTLYPSVGVTPVSTSSGSICAIAADRVSSSSVAE